MLLDKHTRLDPMKTIACTRCGSDKLEYSFSWNDAAHTKRDIYCRPCRAELKRARYVPQRTIHKYNMPEHLLTNPYQEMPEWQKAYVAGLVDGEGCVRSSYPKSRDHSLKLSIAMVHKPTMTWLAGVLGVKCRGYQSAQAKARYRYEIRVPAARTGHLLKTIYPYMITKREEADVAIQIWDTLWCERVSRCIPEDILELRNQLGQRLRDLKRVEWK